MGRVERLACQGFLVREACQAATERHGLKQFHLNSPN